MHKPCFNNLLKVLQKKVPDRPTLFDFFLNDKLYRKLAGEEIFAMEDEMSRYRTLIHAYMNAGYDYAAFSSVNFYFPKPEVRRISTRSLNEGAVITDWNSYEKYPWPEPSKCDYSYLEKTSEILPEGFKIIAFGPDGVLENVIKLVGYDALCYMLYDDEDLAKKIFDSVGSRFVEYYRICAGFDAVGAIISNDDWGYKNQTLFSRDAMRKYVFPWHKKIVEAVHETGKPVILHSCGKLDEIMDDIIYDMKYDAKHSYEDVIMPVEEAYEKLCGEIAVLGGMDMDFMCRSTPVAIKERAYAMLERTGERGGYALGTGNSVPEYIPEENYFAMISAVL